MQQTTLMQETLQIETTDSHGRKITRITDEEGNMIAKVNGPANRAICEAMVKAYNNRQNFDRMKSLLRFRLTDILRDVKGSSLVAYAIREVFNQEGNIEQMIEDLKSQTKDNPPLMVGIIGGEAVQILQLL